MCVEIYPMTNLAKCQTQISRVLPDSPILGENQTCCALAVAGTAMVNKATHKNPIRSCMSASHQSTQADSVLRVCYK